MLIAPIIPHHHHDGVACVVMERCAQDNAYNDEHTGHQESSNGLEKAALCVENAQYLAAKSELGGKASSNDGLYPPSLLYSALTPPFDAVPNITIDVSIQLAYGELIFTYQSADAARSNSLRAPPFTIA